LPDYSPTEAARACGKSRETIFRAMKKGRLSFKLNGAGERRIDAAELDRVFPRDAPRQEGHAMTLSATRQERPSEMAIRYEAEREKTEELRRTVEDLRRRLDESEAERRRVTDECRAMTEQMRALLTDQRAVVPLTAPPPAPRRSWWRWSR
jgi:hypothetical protein